MQPFPTPDQVADRRHDRLLPALLATREAIMKAFEDGPGPTWSVDLPPMTFAVRQSVLVAIQHELALADWTSQLHIDQMDSAAVLIIRPATDPGGVRL